MHDTFWLDDAAWSAIEPLLPTNQPGAHRVDDRRVISGIMHILRCGCRWKDCPAIYGPPTTIYNRFNRWSRSGLWQRLFAALVETCAPPVEVAIDSSYIKAHLSGWRAWRGKSSSHRPVARRTHHESPCTDGHRRSPVRIPAHSR
jgi:transposase